MFCNLRLCSFSSLGAHPLKMTPSRERTKSNVEAGAIFGASGVDGTQNDSTRTAKSNGAERTVEMENPIVYILF